jgi:hypothetical protein
MNGQSADPPKRMFSTGWSRLQRAHSRRPAGLVDAPKADMSAAAVNDENGWLSAGPLLGRDTRESDIRFKAQPYRLTESGWMTFGDPRVEAGMHSQFGIFSVCPRADGDGSFSIIGSAVLRQKRPLHGAG